MATITRGAQDDRVQAVKTALDAYEAAHSGAAAALYRQNNWSIRVRIVDAAFARSSKGDRHDEVVNFLSPRLSDEVFQEISVLILLAPAELAGSLMNMEFDRPLESAIK